jgi:fermentation-respiration switch protein FrsA (DUF1100 family)
MVYIVIILVLILLYLLTCFFLCVFQDKIIYIPSKEIFRTPSDEGMEYEDIDLYTSDGVCINAWHIPNDQRKETVLFCHGNGGSMSHRIDTIKLINDLGFSVFIFDYRGYGISEGTPSEKGTYLDSEAALKYLLEDKKISEERIIIWGRSLGGPIAANLAKEQKFFACVLESTFTSIKDMAKLRFKIFPSALLAKYRYSTIDYVKDIDIPLLIVHSPEDDIIPFWMGEKIFKEAEEPKEFLELKGDHNNTYFYSQAKYTTALKKFFTIP